MKEVKKPTSKVRSKYIVQKYADHLEPKAPIIVQTSSTNNERNLSNDSRQIMNN